MLTVESTPFLPKSYTRLETIVTGLPEPRKDHAVVMSRFARDCMDRMNELTGQLEVLLG